MFLFLKWLIYLLYFTSKMLEGLCDKLVLSANATDIFNKNKSIRWWPL